jgi:hypothetical protein
MLIASRERAILTSHGRSLNQDITTGKAASLPQG